MFDFIFEIIMLYLDFTLFFKVDMENKNQIQSWPHSLMMGLAIVVIIFWIITICAPSVFWKFMDIILGFFLFTSGISAIINAFKNKDSSLVWLLWIGWFLLALLWFWLIFSYSQLVWTIMIWVFALWALARWIMLVIYWMNSKEQQPLWRLIIGLWGLLFALAIIIAVSDKSEARTLAWICIGISTLFDGISMLIMALKIKDAPSVQVQLINQAGQNEISQWEVIITWEISNKSE